MDGTFDAKATARLTGARFLAAFAELGAQAIEADILQPAEVLLDLYGEDIRARAFVTHDPLRGEMMLRPDFTVPVVQEHMAGGAEPARYCYMGEVFRAQEHAGPREAEFFQVGYEVFDRVNTLDADAEVFALFHSLLAPLGLRAAVGDIGLLLAAIDGLDTTDKRKAALKRHIWHPKRFRALLDRFAGRSAVPASRQALLAALDSDAPLTQAPMIGLRSQSEIAKRLTALQEDAATAPLSPNDVAGLETLFAIADKAPKSLETLQELALTMPAIAGRVAMLETRFNALDAKGIDLGGLDFEATYGRTTLEYYDGFVFGFYDASDAGLPPVASGGRYDALTRVLGQGREIPAVGGVIRPALVAQLEAKA
ncbi:ATP phosphoribosyltransferase regulatory subunit [Aquimixticola soesokkakensis]|uniref:Histidine--tRNA ligase n=1 Tax=Aquimixticola soesokkakensis TaxID=1519096 RepID=A0A1Y5T448_9RHOB|nr:ATP phosphoribosyltransferase regulatory subunit [Aquimixticola soesokkakensis]SLN53743.1 ATP phosphoribosyltransferase regulatory subunit [Aquimixticola soesokkakensis]